MPAAAGAKERGRARVLEGAARAFRAHDYGGIGVDGIAKAAGVTSGAFYAHFPSKAAAFEAAVTGGMDDLIGGIAAFRDEGGDWAARFIDFYLGERLDCDLGTSCALPSLTAEVARGESAVRAIYGDRLETAARILAEGLTQVPGPQRVERAGAILALLGGAASVAMALPSRTAAEPVIAAARAAAHAMLKS